jgi:hypothetical protein
MRVTIHRAFYFLKAAFGISRLKSAKRCENRPVRGIGQ